MDGSTLAFVLLIGVCIGMHFFMHRGHGGHRGEGDKSGHKGDHGHRGAAGHGTSENHSGPVAQVVSASHETHDQKPGGRQAHRGGLNAER